MRTNFPLAFKVALLLAVLLLAWLYLPPLLPQSIGRIDFRPYWSSTYLLAHGEDFGNEQRMDEVERTLTGWKEPFPMMAWFTPVGNVVLLPLVLLPFSQAVIVWLLLNIGFVFLGAVLLWESPHFRGIALLVAFLFPMTLASLFVGQVNTLVLLGLALFLVFMEKKRSFMAGLCLILTLIKPHLVLVTLPVILFRLLQQREWRVLAGLLSGGVACGAILWLLDPEWMIHFWHLAGSGLQSARLTPTLSGLLTLWGAGEWGKWVWVPVLGGMLWGMGHKRFLQNISLRTLIDLSLMIGLFFSPFGWSYDQILLLFPLLSLLNWIITGQLQGRLAGASTGGMVLLNLLLYGQRFQLPEEVGFFWVPLGVGVLYALGWWGRARAVRDGSLTTGSP